LKKIIGVLMFATLSISLVANEINNSKTIMNLDGLLNLVKQNKEIKISEFKRQMSVFDFKKTKALDYGTLDLNIQGLRTDHSGAIFGMKLNERVVKGADLNPASNFAAINYPEDRSSWESKLTFSLPLYTGNKISAYKKITKELITISTLDKQNLINKKQFEVKKGFYSIVLIEELIIQIGTIKTNTEFLRNSVNELKIEGYATKTDLLLIDARLAEIDSLLHQLNTNKELALHFVSFLTSKKIDGITYTKDNLIFTNISDDKLLTQNIDIQKAKKAIEIKKNQVLVSSSAYLPEVGLMGEYGSNNENMFGNLKDHDYYMIGVGAKWNIFNGGATNNDYSKAKINLLKQKTTLNYAKEGLLLKADDIRTKIKNLNFKLNSLNKEKAYKKQIFENFKESHKEQRASMNDVLIHQSKYIQTLMKLEENKNLRYEEIFKFETLYNGEEI